jgi:S1-C subfamily serine protease
MKRIRQIILIFLLSAFLLSSCNVQLPESISNLLDAAVPAPAAEPIKEQNVPPADQQNSISPQIVTLTDPQALQNAYNTLFDQVSPSVVHIQVISQGTTLEQQFPDFPFSAPGNEQREPRLRQSSGSGFIWNKEGMIVTNDHVIDGAQTILVEFSDGLRLEAELIGKDPASDLAVIQVNAEQSYLSPVTLADSTQVRTGDIAIAIGNPYGLQNTMTVGIVSALGRSLPLQTQSINGALYSIPDVIQTDAPINPGNSGGVLVNLGGQVIGVTSAIESTSGANAGIGYVIPSVIVNKVVPALIENGSYDHPWIGISGGTIRSEVAAEMDLPATQRGALINEVIKGSPADVAGLRGSDETIKINGTEVNIGGDIITAIDGTTVDDFEDLVAYLARYTDVDQTVTLTILRNGKEKQIDLTLASRGQHNRLAGTPWIGIQIMDLNTDLAEAAGLDKDLEGVLVVQISADSPAEKAGLRGSYKSVEIKGNTYLVGGDIITAIDDEKVETTQALTEIVASHQVGDEITLTVFRDGEEISLPVELSNQP